MADEAEPLEIGTQRVEAFSDAVMAVIMTIMAFDLKPPHGVTLAAVEKQMPGLLVYVLSFTFIGIYWNNHHHLMRATKRISGAVMWANLLLLFWLSLIPVLTAWLRNDYRFAWPAAAYGGLALLAAISYTILVRMIVRVNGADSAVAKAIGSDVKGYASLAMYAAGFALAFVSPWFAYALYAAVAVMWIIPDRRFTRGRTSRAHG
jgi:uncharacterized membrane protein